MGGQSGAKVRKIVKNITDYHQKEGIWLDADKIKWNPGLRSLAKLMFNRYDEFFFMFIIIFYIFKLI